MKQSELQALHSPRPSSSLCDARREASPGTCCGAGGPSTPGPWGWRGQHRCPDGHWAVRPPLTDGGSWAVWFPAASGDRPGACGAPRTGPLGSRQAGCRRLHPSAGRRPRGATRWAGRSSGPGRPPRRPRTGRLKPLPSRPRAGPSRGRNGHGAARGSSLPAAPACPRPRPAFAVHTRRLPARGGRK